MDMESRIIELESRLAFQDDTIAALNDVVVEQQRAIERLQLQVAVLARRQEEMAGQFGIAEDEAPPPHY
ncbi:SlyX family protein [Pseudomonas subflava]|uniref:SlyX family protein n=1 Tax=Pseudomonas subflava TaxID=2952933 RepID=UPI00207A1124|nr:SlyX family protein [Pseudomonas subflava]HSX71321.1 SlyX family protein [Pseudomonas sp.]